MTKQTRRKCWILAADALVVPGMILCKHLTDLMLSVPTECKWTTLGGKCVTCGGTHFVNTITQGRILEAYHHNEFLFFLTVFLAASFILLNLYWLFDLKFAQKILSRLYRLPTLIVAAAAVLVFFILRNIPVFVNIFEILSSR